MASLRFASILSSNYYKSLGNSLAGEFLMQDNFNVMHRPDGHTRACSFPLPPPSPLLLPFLLSFLSFLPPSCFLPPSYPCVSVFMASYPFPVLSIPLAVPGMEPGTLCPPQPGSSSSGPTLSLTDGDRSCYMTLILCFHLPRSLADGWIDGWRSLHCRPSSQHTCCQQHPLQ